MFQIFSIVFIPTLGLCIKENHYCCGRNCLTTNVLDRRNVTRASLFETQTSPCLAYDTFTLDTFYEPVGWAQPQQKPWTTASSRRQWWGGHASGGPQDDLCGPVHLLHAEYRKYNTVISYMVDSSHHQNNVLLKSH